MYVPTDDLNFKRCNRGGWVCAKCFVQETRLLDRCDGRPGSAAPDFDTKTSALNKVTRWIHEDYNRVAMLGPTFNKAGLSLSALNEAYFLDERELQVLAQHHLASIGGHTVSHAALASLDALSARAEMVDNHNYLEDLFRLPVRHFAYPYGNSRACGFWEEQLAREVGFSTAVTTRHGQYRISS